ncbi:MAG: nucleoside-diphosphate kinase [Candidatus Cloacimonadota bacterium]|nr:nucleoside-diphosphate kinase [Candidatus Cloacimonadota bacterium]
MSKEKTLCLIKPDAVKKHVIGEIISILEESNFEILKMKMLRMDKEIASKFYAVHKEKHFYNDLIAFMTSGNIVALVLERVNAIKLLHKLCGNTDSTKAAENTIRHKFGTDYRVNAVHSSDCPDSANYEINTIFK